jgi:hypothetical protein
MLNLSQVPPPLPPRGPNKNLMARYRAQSRVNSSGTGGRRSRHKRTRRKHKTYRRR